MSASKKSPPKISPLMHKLATYIVGARRRALPAAVTERAKHHLLDTIAAMLSGSKLLPGRRAIEFVATQGGVPEATVIGSKIVTSAINAALANGMSGDPHGMLTLDLIAPVAGAGRASGDA